MSTTSSFNVIQLFVRCYLVPTLVKYIVQAIGIKDSKLAAIACVFISTLINSGMDYGASAGGGGGDGAGADVAVAVEEADVAVEMASEVSSQGGNLAAAAAADGAAGAAGEAAAGAAATAAVDGAATGAATAAADGAATGAAATAAADGAATGAAADGAAGATGEAAAGATGSAAADGAAKSGDLAGAAKDATKSIGGYLGSVKDYFSKAMTFGGKTGLTGALIDASKAAVITAVKLYVAEALSGTNKQLAKSVGYLAGLGVGFAVEQGLEYATGVVVGGVNKDGPTAEKAKDEESLNKALKDQRDKFLTQMLGEAVCQVVLVAGSYAGVNEDLLSMGGALTKRLAMDYMAKSKKEEELESLKTQRAAQENQQAGGATNQQSKESLDQQIAKKEKELEQFSTENVMKKALLYGVSDLALRKLSSYAPSPLQGAQINLALTGLVQAIAVDEENVVKTGTDEKGQPVVSPSESGKDFWFYGHIIGNSVDQATIDFATMGRGKAKIVGSGTDERLGVEWTSGNDIFFASRYGDYVTDVVNHGTTYAMANQLASSMHNQAVANVYDVASGEVNQRQYKVKDWQGQAEKYQKSLAKAKETLDALRTNWPTIEGKLTEAQRNEVKKFLDKAGDPYTWDTTTWKDYGLYVANVAAAVAGSSAFVGLVAAGTNGEGSRGDQMDQRVTAGSRAAGSFEKGNEARVLVEAARDAIKEAGEARGELMSNRMYSQLTAVAEGTIFKDSAGNVISQPDYIRTLSSSELVVERMKQLDAQKKKQSDMLKQDTTTMKEIKEKAIQDFLANNSKINEKLENLTPQDKEKILAKELSSADKEKINNAIKAEVNARATAAAQQAFEAKGDLNIKAQYQTHIGSGTYYDETWQPRTSVGASSPQSPLGREVAPPAYMKDFVSQPEEGVEFSQVRQFTLAPEVVTQTIDGAIKVTGGNVTTLEDNRGYVDADGSQDFWVRGGEVIKLPDGSVTIKNIPTGGVFLAQPEQMDNSSSQATSVVPQLVSAPSPSVSSPNSDGPSFPPIKFLSDEDFAKLSLSEKAKYVEAKEREVSSRKRIMAQYEQQKASGAEPSSGAPVDASGNFKPYTVPVIKESTIMARPDGSEVTVPQFNQMTMAPGTVTQEGNGWVKVTGDVMTLEEGDQGRQRGYVDVGGDQSYYVKGTISKLPDGSVFINNIQPGDVTIAEAQPAFVTPQSNPQLKSGQSYGGREVDPPKIGSTEDTFSYPQNVKVNLNIPVQYEQVTLAPGAVTQEGNGWVKIKGDMTRLSPGEGGEDIGYMGADGDQEFLIRGGRISKLPDGTMHITNIPVGGVVSAQPEQMANVSNQQGEEIGNPAPVMKAMPQVPSEPMKLRPVNPENYLPPKMVRNANSQPEGESVTLVEPQQSGSPLPAVNLPVYDPKIPSVPTASSPEESGVTSNIVSKPIPTQDVNPGTEERARQNYEMLLKARQEIRQEKGIVSNDNRSDLKVEPSSIVSEMPLATVPQAPQVENWEAGLSGDMGGWVNSSIRNPMPVQAVEAGGRDFIVGDAENPLPTDMVAAADNVSPFPSGIKNSPSKIVSDANLKSREADNPNFEVKGDGSLSDRAATVMNNAYKNAPISGENASIRNQPNDERSRQMDVDFNKTKSTTIGPTWPWDFKASAPKDD
jgi:hypothetical protein